MGFYLKRVVTKDIPADVAWRKTYADAVAQVDADSKAKFPVVTVDNLKAYADYRQDRLAQLLNNLK